MNYFRIYSWLLAGSFVCLFPGCGRESQNKENPESAAKYIVGTGQVYNQHTPLLITPDMANVMAIYSSDSTFLWFPFTISEKIDFSTLRFAAPDISGKDIRINNHPVAVIPYSYFLDEKIRLYEIGQYVGIGENKVEVDIDIPYREKYEAGYLLGIFSVFPTKRGFEIRQPVPLQTGNWVDQGMPFYGDAVTYSKIYSFSDFSSYYYLSLSDWKGSRLEIYINNHKIYESCERTCRLKINRYLQPGDNRIDIKVVGEMVNTTGPFFSRDSVQNHSIPGEYYRFLPCGMYKDFIVEQF